MEAEIEKPNGLARDLTWSWSGAALVVVAFFTCLWFALHLSEQFSTLGDAVHSMKYEHTEMLPISAPSTESDYHSDVSLKRFVF